MMNAEEFEKNIQVVKKYWNQSIGLVIVELLFLTIYYSVIVNYVRDIDAVLPRYIVPYFNITAPFVVMTTLLIIWCFGRKAPRFSDKEIGILFCPYVNEKDIDISARLKNSLKTEIENYNLKIVIKDLPSHHVIRNQQDASKMVYKTNCCLLIWGGFERGNIRAVKVAGFRSINFCFRHPKIRPEALPAFTANLGLGMVGKEWYVNEGNDFFDIHKLSRNISEASLNILGKILAASGEHDKSIEVLELFLNERLSAAANSNSSFVKDLILSVKKVLAFSYCEKARIIYVKDIFEKISEEWPLTIIQDCLKLIVRSIDYYPKYTNQYQIKGIFDFLLSDIPTAKRDILTSIKYNYYQNGLPYLSYAFLCFFEGDIGMGLKFYSKGLKRDVPIQGVIDILSFIDKVITKYPEKFQFHLALGIINKEKFDLIVAENEITSFIELAKIKHIYEQFIINAEEILVDIKKK